MNRVGEQHKYFSEPARTSEDASPITRGRAWFPGRHLLSHQKPAFCAELVVDFLTDESVHTRMPIRRAAASGATAVRTPRR